MPNTRLTSRYDFLYRQNNLCLNRYDTFLSITFPHSGVNRFDINNSVSNKILSTFDSICYSDIKMFLPNLFDYHQNQFNSVKIVYDVINERVNTMQSLRFRFDAVFGHKSCESNRLNVISDYLFRLNNAAIRSRFSTQKGGDCLFPVRFQNIPQEFLTRFISRFDILANSRLAYPNSRQSFVKPGWRIIATDISTGTEHEIGFIDADSANREISGVWLPDGDYEISVLTSSLFWKDTLGCETRLLKISENDEISPLPIIYNLRTSVSNGTRTVSWSAGKSEVGDCVFGVWFSQNTPVDTSSPPDKAVWFSSQMTEYSVSFPQQTPLFTAVAAIRTGDNAETSKGHEIFCDWNSTPPRQPDDVIIHQPLTI
ncbi:MAG: hypothetical protein ACRC2T_08520 [Thermoguttaceae bacterium]